jgi:hypothetical protein
MYQKPELTRFGTFREITLQGRYGPSDGAVLHGDGCTYTPTRCS